MLAVWYMEILREATGGWHSDRNVDVEMDHEEAAGMDRGEAGLRFASPGGDPFVQGAGWPGGELSLRTLTTALARVMDVLPVEVVLCSPAGSILHANHPARERLEADGSRKSIKEEIRFLCVGLHLQIAEEEAGREERGAVSQAERRVRLDGSEVHLRAVDLGIPRYGGSPTTLVLLDAQEHPLSDQDLEQEGLTRAEIRIARLVMRGATNREIAGELSISVHTVRHHVQHILAKVGVRSRTRLMETLHLLKVRPGAETPSPEGVADGRHRRG
jgi:DNA-binding CsgD family transcriptional regulator